MGLSVVHGIVKSMNGTIQINSEPEKGTQFYVYLPLEKSLLVAHETRSKAEIQRGTEQILLVDDERFFQWKTDVGTIGLSSDFTYQQH
jgi:hypothetical protein